MKGGSRVGTVKARMYHRTRTGVTEKNTYFFLKSVAWKVGHYYAAVRNAGVRFMLPLMFSVEEMQLTEVSLLALISS